MTDTDILRAELIPNNLNGPPTIAIECVDGFKVYRAVTFGAELLIQDKPALQAIADSARADYNRTKSQT